jgi:hypothetical protein
MEMCESMRRNRLVELGIEAADRATLEHRHGQVWDPQELRRDFKVIGFLAPYAVVRRLSDGVLGSLEFQPSPRFYFNWKVDEQDEQRKAS